MTIQTIADKAREIAAARSFTYDSNQGTKDAFTYTVKVHADMQAGSVTLSADCNARISKDRASAA